MSWIPMLPLAFTLIAFLLGTTLGDVIINEVELNPAGVEDARKSPAQAWVELYNNDKDVNIGGWSVNTADGRSVMIPEGTIIQAFDYYIVVGEPQWLAYTEILVLKNQTGAELDRTPALSDTQDNELAWTRDPDGRDTDGDGDWKFLPASSGF